jgi:hypothetical protein
MGHYKQELVVVYVLYSDSLDIPECHHALWTLCLLNFLLQAKFYIR